MFRGLFFSKVTRNKIRKILVKNHWRKLRWFTKFAQSFWCKITRNKKQSYFACLHISLKLLTTKLKNIFLMLFLEKSNKLKLTKTLFEDFIDQIFLLWKIYFKKFSWKTAANMGRSFRLQLLRHWKVSKDWKSDGKVIGCAVKTAYF